MGRLVNFYSDRTISEEDDLIIGNTVPSASSPSVSEFSLPSESVKIGSVLVVPLQMLGVVVGYLKKDGNWMARVYIPSLKQEISSIPAVIKPEMGIREVSQDLLEDLEGFFSDRVVK